MKRSKGYLFRACPSKRVIHHHLHLAETLRHAGEYRSSVVENREGLTCVLIGGCWHGQAGGRLIRNKESYALS